MFNPQKTLQREALLRRHRELQVEIAQHERNMREGEARLPMEEQLALKLRRFIEHRQQVSRTAIQGSTWGLLLWAYYGAFRF